MSTLPERKLLRGLVVADFNADIFCGYLSNAGTDDAAFRFAVKAGPYSQVFPLLLNPAAPEWDHATDFTIVWTRPESILPSLQRALDYEEVATDALLADVDAFTDALRAIQPRTRFAFVPSWTARASQANYELLDSRLPEGVENLLHLANLRLAANLRTTRNIFALPARRWIERLGEAAYSPKLWYLAKVPFSNALFREAARSVRAAGATLLGASRKLVVVDLDDTLWGGVIGDQGVAGIRLGGHDYSGEAFQDFQRALKALTRRGILLGIVSKNEESVALDAIRSHPEMILRQEDFAGWRINWNDKARNIAELAAELNLGLQSIVFIDDNPVERARVREALPEVLVPDWPADKTLYSNALLGLGCFDSAGLTEEDRQRTEMYSSERQRSALKVSVGSYASWLETLGVEVQVEPLVDASLKRVAQLLNKTNQLNLRTRRMTEAELADWARRSGNSLWAFRVTDKFGDLGLTGIISLAAAGKTGLIEDFVLSCRVMGRNVEELMVHVAVEAAAALELERVEAHYVKTAKNKPTVDFWLRSGFAHDPATDVFSWDTRQPYPMPRNIKVLRQ